MAATCAEYRELVPPLVVTTAPAITTQAGEHPPELLTALN
jgi:hypothetical protein